MSRFRSVRRGASPPTPIAVQLRGDESVSSLGTTSRAADKQLNCRGGCRVGPQAPASSSLARSKPRWEDACEHAASASVISYHVSFEPMNWCNLPFFCPELEKFPHGRESQIAPRRPVLAEPQ